MEDFGNSPVATTGWKCCKPRVLTFDEFLEIQPCTTGIHSTVDETPAPPKPTDTPAPSIKPNASKSDAETALPPPAARVPTPAASATPTAAAPPESDSDDPSASIPAKVTCKRRGCGATSGDESSKASRDDEKCVYHPGQALFHEGSKGWTCCKKRVLEFDEFMQISGCKTRTRHCFVGKKGAKRKPNGAGQSGSVDGVGGDDEEYEKVENVRHDFYQTPVQVHASLYLKKVDKEKSKIRFRDDGVGLELDLKTADEKRYQADVPLYGKINPEKSSFAIKGTKVDLTLVKADGLGWPVLRADEKPTGEIIQTGRAGRA